MKKLYLVIALLLALAACGRNVAADDFDWNLLENRAHETSPFYGMKLTIATASEEASTLRSVIALYRAANPGVEIELMIR